MDTIGRQPTPYEEIAKLVRARGQMHGNAAYLAERFGVPHATARSWIARARLKGLLPTNAEHPCPTCKGSGIRRFGRFTPPS